MKRPTSTARGLLLSMFFRLVPIGLVAALSVLLAACGSSSSNSSSEGPKPPAAPTGLAATAHDANNISLTWNQVGDSNTDYLVYRSTSPGVQVSAANQLSGAPSNQYIDVTVTSKTAYYYVVTAHTGAGEGAPSAEVSATTPALPPPSIFSITSGADKVSMSFDFNAASGATGGRLYRGTAAGVQTIDANKIATFTTVAVSYIDTNVVSGTTYYYNLIVSDATGDSPPSGESSVVYKDPAPPGGVTNVKATTLVSFQVQLSWTNPTESDFTGVRIKRSAIGYPTSATIASPSDATVVAETTGSTATFTDTKVPGGVPYYYSLFAHDGTPSYASAGQIGATPSSAGIYAYAASSSGIVGYQIDSTANNFLTIPGSPYSSSSVNSVTVDPTGKFLYAVSQSGTAINGYTIDAASGKLNFMATNVSTGSGPGRVVVDPSGKFAFVANTTSTGSNGVSAYTIDATTGVLTVASGSPFATGNHPQMVAIYSSGTGLTSVPKVAFVPNNFSNTVSAFTIDATAGTLTTATGSPFAAGVSPLAVAVDSSDLAAFVINNGSTGTGAVSGYTFSSSTGVMTPAAGSPFAGNGTPQAITVFNFHAYAASKTSGNVSAYSIGLNTGVLTPVAGSPFSTGTGPLGLAVTASGYHAYTPNSTAASLGGYTIDSTTGALTAITGSPFSTGTVASPQSVTLDFTLGLAFAPDASSGIAAFSLNSTTGALTVLSASPLPASSPKGLTVVHTELTPRVVYSPTP